MFYNACSSAEKLLDFSLLHNPEVFPNSQVQPRAKAHHESGVPSAYFGLDHICVISQNYQDNFSQDFLHGIKYHFPSELQKIFSFSCTYRKKCLLCNNVLMIVAASIMGCSKIAQSFEMILIGRFMCGVSAGE